MRCVRIAILCLSLLLVFGCGGGEDDKAGTEKMTPVEEVVAAERAFAKDAQDGVSEAFVRHFAHDGIVFRPMPANAREVHAENPFGEAMLSWEPVYAEADRLGDLGYTTGPYVFKPGPQAEQEGHGQFMSIWKMQPDSTWRVVLDIGTPNPPPDGPADTLITNQLGKTGSAGVVINPEPAVEMLKQLDRDMSQMSIADGLTPTYVSFAADNIRFLRANQFPVVGKTALEAALPDLTGAYTWEPTAGGIAKSGQLGYTYGVQGVFETAGDAEPIGRNSYVHIWRKNEMGDWMLALDIAIQINEEATGE